MRSPRAILRLLPFLLLGAYGCQPKIGDDCVTDLDCSQAGDRLCDTTQLDGYCTMADCDPLSCPEKEKAVCVSFNTTISTQGSCNMRGQTSPYRRSFCMAICKESGDCRDGYACIDMNKANDWGAEVIQDDPERTTVCVQAMSHPEQSEDQDDQVCTGVSSSPTAAGGAGGASAD